MDRFEYADRAGRVGFEEGVRARRDGHPKLNPYAYPDGRPFVLFVRLYLDWERGWSSAGLERHHANVIEK